MSKLSKRERLNALQALIIAYREILQDWLRNNNKKGVRYTIRMRREWVEGGQTHFGEREFCEPMRIKKDGDLVITSETLPYLSITKMNSIFKKAGYAPPPWEYLATHYSAEDRAVILFNADYARSNKLYTKN